jgi:hypothetical protein
MAPQINWHAFLSLLASEPLGLFDEGMGYPLGKRLGPTYELWSMERHEG